MTATVTTYTDLIQGSSPASFNTGIQTALAGCGFPSPLQATISGGYYYLVYQLSRSVGTYNTVFWVLTWSTTTSTWTAFANQPSLMLFETWDTGTLTGTNNGPVIQCNPLNLLGTSAFLSAKSYTNVTDNSYGFTVLTDAGNNVRFVLGFLDTLITAVPNQRDIAPTIHGLCYIQSNVSYPYVLLVTASTARTIANSCNYGSVGYFPSIAPIDSNGIYQIIKPACLRYGTNNRIHNFGVTHNTGYNTGFLSSDFVMLTTTNGPTPRPFSWFNYGDTFVASSNEIYTYVGDGLAVRTT